MTDRSVPFNFGKGTSLRFDRADFKAIENILGMGYPFFTKHGVFGSITASEAFLWRGLRMEAPDGKLLHVFPMNDAGREEAGDALMEYLQKGQDNGGLNDAIRDAFVASGLFYRPSPEPKPQETGSEGPKNSTT